MKHVKLFEQFIAEGRNGVGKYNTVKKVVAELGRRPSEQELATFITNNYYDITEVERGDDDPSANDKIADLVAFYKFDIDDWEIAWADAQNESVVTEAKNTIGLAFKEEQDYLDFVEFIKDERGSIKKDFGWDSKTKSWEVIMDVKVLDRIYGEGTPGNKESGWYGGLPGDFESVIIESVVTEGIFDRFRKRSIKGTVDKEPYYFDIADKALLYLQKQDKEWRKYKLASVGPGDKKTHIMMQLMHKTNHKTADPEFMVYHDKNDNIEKVVKLEFNYESIVTEAKPAGLTKEETLKVAQKFADAIAEVDGVKVTVNMKTLEEDSFDLDYDGTEFDGGSYNINADGSVVNMAVRKQPTVGTKDDDVKTIVKFMKKHYGKLAKNESAVTEALEKRRED